MSLVRTVLYAAALALATACSPEMLRGALVASASALFEVSPFLFAGALAWRLIGRRCSIVAHLGCGCGNGPSARSLPAAAATWLAFGPAVALARYLAATIAARLLRRRENVAFDHTPPQPLDEIAAVLPAALVAGAATQLFVRFDPAGLSPLAGALAGAALGFVAAPCGLGAVALAATLRAHAPIAAAAFLCIAGVVDVHALRGDSRRGPSGDCAAYVILAAALAIVAWRHGDALVHPLFTLPLAACVPVCTIAAIACRRSRCGRSRVAPALMLFAALAGAPAPRYAATETTLTGLFPGERIVFIGTLTHDAHSSALARYAITCCRADAAPVVLRLAVAPAYSAGTWLRAAGRIETFGSEFRLVAESVQPVPAPVDPFIYR